MVKKGLYIGCLFMVIMLVLSACGDKKEEPAAQAPANQEPAVGASAGQDENAEAGKEEPADQTATEVIINHMLGETTVKIKPEKVIVFDMGILDSLDELGIPITGVPQSNIPPYLAKFKGEEYTNVGTLQEPDFETIYGLQPDVIFISARQSSAYDELSRIAPTVYLGVDNQDYMNSFTQNMKVLGQIFDQESRIEQELAQINDTIQQLNELAKAEDQSTLVVLTNGGKVSAYGPGSRFGIIHEVFGLTPVDNNIEVSTHGMSISFEYIVEKNPDILLVVDRDSVVSGGDPNSSAQQVIENELVKKTKAYENGRITYLDANYWYLSGGGLVSIKEMIRGVQEAVQK